MIPADDHRLGIRSGQPPSPPLAKGGKGGVGEAQDNPRVVQALEEYLALMNTGNKPDRDRFLARYSDISGELAECLDGLEFIQVAGPQLDDSAAGPERTAEEELLGKPLGDYRLIREVGRGGMGIVYEAEQQSLGRRVALKVLPFAAALDPKQLQRFRNEAHAAAQLHHQNIVPVYGVGSERGVHYYAMQFIDGQTLAGLIGELRGLAQPPSDQIAPKVVGPSLARDLASGAWAPAPGVLTAPYALGLETFAATPQPAPAASTEPSTRSPAFFRTVARLGQQAAEGLEHAHQFGVIHRDIKPANLLVDSRGNLWITDFGLAQMQTDNKLTLSGDLVGTLRYMSPEQALAQRVGIDHRTDIYSLGVTLYELLTLEPAYSGGDRQELLRQIAFDEPRRPRRLNPSIPKELETIVLKAMAKNPAERYSSAQELADDLERFLKDEPIRAKRPSLWQRARKFARRHRAVVTTASIAAGVLVIVMLVWFWREHVLTLDALDRVQEEKEQVKKALVQVEEEKKETEIQKKKTEDQRDLVKKEKVFAEAQRELAMGNFKAAMDALDPYFDFLTQGLTKEPHREAEYRQGLKEVLKFCETFSKKNKDNPLAPYHVALAYFRAGDIHRLMRNYPAAEAAYHEARPRFEKLVAESPGKREHRQGLAILHFAQGNLRKETGQLKEAEREWVKAGDLLALLAPEFPDYPILRFSLANTHHDLARVFMETGRFAQAEKANRAALEALDQLATQFPEILEYSYGLAASYNNLAWFLYETAKFHDAEKTLRDALLLYQKAKKDLAHVPDFRHQQALAQANLGNVLTHLGRPGEAEKFYREAIAGLTALAEEYANVPAFRQSLGNTQHGLGVLLKNQGDKKAAIEQFRLALGQRTHLANSRGSNPENRFGLALTHKELGQLCRQNGEFREAADHYAHAHLLLVKLVEDVPDVPAYRSELAHSYALQSRVVKTGPQVLEQYRQAIEVNTKLMKDYPAVPRHRHRLATTHLQLGNFLRNSDPRAAGESLRQGLDLRRQLAEDHPEMPSFRADLSEAHNTMGNLLHEIGDKAGAEKHLRRATDLMTELAEKFPQSPKYRAALAISLNNLGVTHKRTEAKEAEKLYRRALDLRQRLVEDFPAAHRYQSELAGSHYNLGRLLADGGDPQAGLDHVGKARALQEALVQKYPHIAEYRMELAMSHTVLGSLNARGKEWPAAFKHFHRAIELQIALVEEYPHLPVYRIDLAGTHHNLGLALEKSGDLAAAADQRRKVLALHSKLAQDFPQNPAFAKKAIADQEILAQILEELGWSQKSEKTLREALDLRENLAKSPGGPNQQSRVGNTLHLLAGVLKDQSDKKSREAAGELLQRAITCQQAALAVNAKVPIYREKLRNHFAALADVRLLLQDHFAAAKAAAELPRVFADRWQDYRQAASFLARCVTLANKDSLPQEKRRELARSYGDQAIAMLRHAIKHGYRDAAELKNAAALEPLRSHPEFQKLLTEVEAKKLP